MKTIKILSTIPSVITLLILSQASFAEDEKSGGDLFKQYCSACHGSMGGMDMSKRIAPPIAAVRMHYIGRYPDKSSFVQAVTSWVEKQDAGKSLMRGAIRRFNIMPPISIPQKEAKKIAAYLYEGNIEKPEGFEEHVQEEHGKNGRDHDKHEDMDHDGMHEKGMKE